MAVQNSFFGRREPPESLASRLSSTPASASPSPSPAFAAATRAVTDPVQEPATNAGSKLTVGPNIKLKGVEITDCDTLEWKAR